MAQIFTHSQSQDKQVLLCTYLPTFSLVTLNGKNFELLLLNLRFKRIQSILYFGAYATRWFVGKDL